MAKFILLAVAVLVAAPAWGQVNEEGNILRVLSAVQNKVVVEHYLCDRAATDGLTCPDLEIASLSTSSTGSPKLPWPSRITFDLVATTECAGAVSIELKGRSDAAGVEHQILAAMTELGTSSFTPAQGATFGWYNATLSVATGCSDVEVIVRTEHGF